MTLTTETIPRVLLLHQNSSPVDEIENFRIRLCERIDHPALHFQKIEAPRISMIENHIDYDLIVPWLSFDFVAEESVVDWIDRWVETRSPSPGGSIFFVANRRDTSLSMRFWKAFTQSIGTFGGISVHWQSKSEAGGGVDIANAVNQWADHYSVVG